MYQQQVPEEGACPEVSESNLMKNFFSPPPFNDLDNIFFTHIRHGEVVGPCSLGKREEAIEFRTSIAYLSQGLLVNEDLLKKFFNDFQLPVYLDVSISQLGEKWCVITNDGGMEVPNMRIQI